MEAKTTTADNTNTGILSKVANAIKGHKGIVAGGAAVLVAGAIVVASLTAQATGVPWVKVEGSGYDAYPANTQAVADPSTMTSYKQWPKTTDSSNNTMALYDTTQYAGRLWVDKTVTVPSDTTGSITKTALFDLEDETLDWYTDKVDAGTYEVDMSDNATFLTTISALSSALQTASDEPVPLDIVLVLDESGSMKEQPVKVYDYWTYEQLEEVYQTPGKSIKVNNKDSYFTAVKKTDGTLAEGRKAALEGYVFIKDEEGNETKVPYIEKWNYTVDGSAVYEWYLVTEDGSRTGEEAIVQAKFQDVTSQIRNKFSDADTEYHEFKFYYTSLYKGVTNRYKYEDLNDAVDQFITAIAEKNTTVAKNYSLDYLTQISVVRFSGEYGTDDGGTGNYSKQCNKIGNRTGITQIVSPLTTYTTAGEEEGTQPASSIIETIRGFAQGGRTAADNALKLAKAVLDGDAYDDQGTKPGARSGVQSVVILFTDGNPKHDGDDAPRDFRGEVAAEALKVAEQIKKSGTLVYSVAVVDGANNSPDLTMSAEESMNNSQNIDIYLNGVSSNYRNASGRKGTQYKSVYGNKAIMPYTEKSEYAYDLPSEVKWWQPSEWSWMVDLDTWSRQHKYLHTTDSTPETGKTYYKYEDDGTGNYVYTAIESSQLESDIASGKYSLSDCYEEVNYYLTANQGDSSALTAAFMKILTQITAEDATETSATGRDGNDQIVITDYLGDYMEFKGLNGILYGKTASTTMFYADSSQRAYHKASIIIKPDNADTADTVTYSLMPTGTLAGGFALVESSLLNPPEGQEQVSLSGISITVSRSSDPKTGDTVSISIPPELLPTVRYYVEQTSDDSGNVKATVDRNNVEPVRIFYSVGPKTSTVANVISQIEDQALRSENATNESDRQIEDYKTFMKNAASYQDIYQGKYSFFSNAYFTNDCDYSRSSVPTTEIIPVVSGAGTTKVVATLASTNSYYYHVDDPLYIKDNNNEWVLLTDENVNLVSDTNKPHYYACYWKVKRNALTQTHDKCFDDYVEWDGDYGTYDSNLYIDKQCTTRATFDNVEDSPTLYCKLNYKNSGKTGQFKAIEYKGTFEDWRPDTTTYFIPNGTLRSESEVPEFASGAGYTLTKMQFKNTEDNSVCNPTGSAQNIMTSSLGTNDNGNDALIMYLGNNGRLDMPVYGTLAIDKTFKAGTGFELPEDPEPEATIHIILKDEAGNELTGSYTALIRDREGHPVDHVTHQIVSNTANAMFTVTSSETTGYTLRSGETLKITGLPYGATYEVREEGQSGYTGKVTIESKETSGEAAAQGELGQLISTKDVFDPQTTTP